MTVARRISLITLGPAKRLTMAQLPTGMLETQDPTDCWGV
ncbi:hypothetical protein J2728_000162 [Caulobacter segnis]|nr:hypothetical protein [Caulobacter segnis]